MRQITALPSKLGFSAFVPPVAARRQKNPASKAGKPAIPAAHDEHTSHAK
jgi:hypothetical protein